MSAARTSAGGSRLDAAAPAPSWCAVHRPAMGSFFEIRLGARVPGAVELASRALDLIDELEAQLTVYSRRFRGQPAERDRPSRPGRGRAGLFGLLERAVELEPGRPAGPTT